MTLVKLIPTTGTAFPSRGHLGVTDNFLAILMGEAGVLLPPSWSRMSASSPEAEKP